MIEAGRLNRRITIQQKSSTANSFGEPENGWTDVTRVWAELKTLTVKDVNRQHGQKEQAEAKFLIRHRTDVTTTMRLQHNGSTYYVVGTEEYQDGEGLLLFVRRT